MRRDATALWMFSFKLLLQNESLQTDNESVSNAAPDICIVHKLHLECGRLINLYDWMQVSLLLLFAT